jgi:hypothetical protein
LSFAGTEVERGRFKWVVKWVEVVGLAVGGELAVGGAIATDGCTVLSPTLSS